MFFLVLGIIGVIAGCFAVYARADMLKNAKPYIAKMINIEQKVVLRGKIPNIVYRAVVSYKTDTIERTAYHYSYDSYNDYEERFSLGTEFIVYADSRMGEVFYFPQEMKGKVTFAALALLLIGAFFIVVGIIFASRGM